MTSPYTVTIPANLDHQDRLVGNLTARQLAIITPTALLVWAFYLAASPVLPLPVIAALAIPLMGVAAALALVERNGITLDRLALHALAYAGRPRRLVPAPGSMPALPAWAAATGQEAPLPAPLRLPVRAIRADGAINLGAEGVAVIVACSTVSFALRTPGEQAALVGAFGGWLNALTGPAQVLVHAQPINLAPAITALHERATALPHPALEEAALDHARFLGDLAATRELLGRQILIVLREPHAHSATGTGGEARKQRDAEAAAMRVLQRAEQTTRALAAAGITAYPLDGPQACAVLAAAADPTAPPMDPGQALPDEPVTTHRTRTEGRR